MQYRVAPVLAAMLCLALIAGTGAPAGAAPLPTGTHSLESVNYPGRYVRHLNQAGRLEPVTPSSPTQARLDATFCPVDGAVAGSVALAAYNYPTHRIRHRDFGLQLDAYQDSASFRADSSFRLAPPLAPATNQGPAIPGLFADPHLTIFNGRYHLYPTTDGYAGWAAPCYQAFSSPDLVNWTAHGVILDHGPDVSWADDSAWAPAVAARDGRYYLYFSGGAASGDPAKHLGVAVADTPTGPFRDALGRPLIRGGQHSGQALDPMVFTDDDGRSSLYWGQGAARVVPLGTDMVSFDPAQVRLITPAGYNEAPFVFKRNGTTPAVRTTGSRTPPVRHRSARGPPGVWCCRNASPTGSRAPDTTR